jgi:hypothetical protein
MQRLSQRTVLCACLISSPSEPRLTTTKSREHQAAHWPNHKAFCKQQRLNNQRIESHQSANDLPPLPERKRLLEDFVDIHTRSIEQAMASAIHVADPPFDFTNQHAFFSLSYRSDSDDNPSTGFTLDSAHFHHNPKGDNPLAANFDAFKPLAEENVVENQRRPGYLGLLTCICRAFFDHLPCTTQTD